MEAKHVVTQVVGTLVAIALARWGWNEFRSDWRDQHRLPLVTGPYMGGRTLLLVLAVIAVLVPSWIAIMKFELIPKHSPGQFVAMLAWSSLIFVFFLLGGATRVARQSAKGWITLLADGTVRIDADGANALLQLAPGVARLRWLEGGGGAQYVQLDLDDGRTRAHVWGMVGLREYKLVGNEFAPQAQGLMVATSMSPLVRQLAPYVRET